MGYGENSSQKKIHSLQYYLNEQKEIKIYGLNIKARNYKEIIATTMTKLEESRRKRIIKTKAENR